MAQDRAHILLPDPPLRGFDSEIKAQLYQPMMPTDAKVVPRAEKPSVTPSSSRNKDPPHHSPGAAGSLFIFLIHKEESESGRQSPRPRTHHPTGNGITSFKAHTDFVPKPDF